MIIPTDEKVIEATHFLEQAGVLKPQIGIILGTGFGQFAGHCKTTVKVPYKQIPHFPVSTVADHAGNFVFGTMGTQHIVMMQGRIHLYEGYTASEVTFPVRVMKQLGVKRLVVTNAAGGLNREFIVGDLMLIDDHINMMGVPTPVSIDHESVKAPASFYDVPFRQTMMRVARDQRIPLRQGILAAMLGPSFETASEIAMLCRLGADAVTMSTIPEVTVARHLGLQIAGLSCISNQCVGNVEFPINHKDVMKVVSAAGEQFSHLMIHVLQDLDTGSK